MNCAAAAGGVCQNPADTKIAPRWRFRFILCVAGKLGGGPRRISLWDLSLSGKEEEADSSGASGTFGPKTRPLSAAYEVS